MTIALIILLALLYVLGRYQGEALADILDVAAAEQGYQIDERGRFLLTWGWPVATILAMTVGDSEPGELG